jgi:hypothetical protein
MILNQYNAGIWEKNGKHTSKECLEINAQRFCIGINLRDDNAMNIWHEEWTAILITTKASSLICDNHCGGGVIEAQNADDSGFFVLQTKHM